MTNWFKQWPVLTSPAEDFTRGIITGITVMFVPDVLKALGLW